MQPHTPSFPDLPESLRGLEAIAANLWWSWHPEARMLYKQLNRQAWKESGHNPFKLLKTLPRETIAAAAADEDYMRHFRMIFSRFEQLFEPRPCPLLSTTLDEPSKTVAYFSAEYGLHHSLPFFAGGLGFLAGDFVKECSDLRVPLVAVGFMYPQGYLHQRIKEDGWQDGAQEDLDREAASITKVIDENGQPLVVAVPFMAPPIYVSVWRIDVGRVRLFLLDTDMEQNDSGSRGISARLYIGDLEQRLRQEIVLGIGGSAVLNRLNIDFGVVHLNEGHAGFALLERLRLALSAGQDSKSAREQVRQCSIFTTHTPVPAGHDVFPEALIEKYFQNFWPALAMGREEFMALGRQVDGHAGGFNMTAMAMRLSGQINAVSRRHAEVTRNMWRGLWPDPKQADSVIDYVTNGVHLPTWIEPKLRLLFNRYLGSEWLDDHDNPYAWELIDEIPDDELWGAHYWLKSKLINAVREQIRLRWVNEGRTAAAVMGGGVLLDPSILTIGFARRFATYKRADLIFEDFERLKQLLRDRWRPLQIIFAGKAHPDDHPGKMVLQKIFNFAKDPALAGRVAFVEDYDEQIAQYMVHGVDVWLNTPLPPMEASGTSGMKAALNGVLNLSIADGWWIEGYNQNNGWMFGKETPTGERNPADAQQLYNLLEQQVIPAFYQVDDKGVPVQWVGMMKAAIKSCAPHFSARRMVKQYLAKLYLPAFSG